MGILLCSLLPLMMPALSETRDLLRVILPNHSGFWPTSPEPLTTVFWAVMLGASILVALYLLSTPLEPNPFRALVAVMTAFSAAYGVVSFLVWKGLVTPPGWLREPGMEGVFGLFPNRNHTAGFLLSGAVLSAGLLLDSAQRGKMRLLLFSSLSLALQVSLLLAASRSRSGMMFLGVGLLIWFVGLGTYSKRPKWLLPAALIFAFLTGLFFITSGAPLWKRLTSGNHSETGAGPRLEIAKDTLPMIGAAPLTGHGMGTYALLYPLHAKASLRYATTALHPESDWLLMAYDSGIAEVILILGVLLMMFLGIPREALASEDWPLRWSMASAFLAEVCHSFIDVPLHRVELGWWILILGGCSASSWSATGSRRRWQGFVFSAGGAGIFAMGLWMILSLTPWIPPTPPFETIGARDTVLRLYGAVPYGDAGPVLAECERLTARYPFNTGLLHQYATFLIQEKTDPGRSAALFAAERMLCPDDADVPFQQGWILADQDPKEAARLWRISIERQSIMDANPAAGTVPRTGELFGAMLTVASQHPQLLPLLSGVAAASPVTRQRYLLQPGVDPSLIREAVMDPSYFRLLEEEGRGRLLEAWWSSADRVSAIAYLSAHPETIKGHPKMQARLIAEEGKPEEACRFLIKHYGVPVTLPESRASLIQGAGADCPADPLQAAKYYVGRGNFLAGARSLEEAGRAGRGEPSERSLVAADLAVAQGHWNLALVQILAFLDATGRP